MIKRTTKFKSLYGFLATKIPFTISFLILLISFANFGFISAKPTLVLIPIFYWGMNKEKSFDFISVLLFGFIQDFMDGTNFGINIFIFLSIYFMVYYQKVFPLDQSFVFSYLSFSLATIILLLIKYFIIFVLFSINLNFFNILLSWAVLILLYPPIYYMLDKLNNNIVKRY